MLVHDVEQNTPEWDALRAGIPTASEFKNLITAKTGKPSTAIDSYARTLAGEKFAGTQLDPFLGNQYTERGHALEDDARRFYRLITNADVHQVGFITDDDLTMGCSPDSLVGEDGLLEIKCLLADKHVECLEYIDAGECPPDYRIQVQGQLFITGRKWCDLYFYHPILPKQAIRIEPDGEIQTLLTSQLTALAEKRDAIHEMLTRQAA
jgi:hypothetical protein